VNKIPRALCDQHASLNWMLFDGFSDDLFLKPCAAKLFLKCYQLSVTLSSDRQSSRIHSLYDSSNRFACGTCSSLRTEMKQ